MFGIVVIGRNEGDRLRACFKSNSPATPLVYVDSGSTDNSTTLAREFGAEVIDLDLRQPFTAARARNAGFQRLREVFPTIKYVQFVDGDCVICPTWLDHAVAFLESHDHICAVFGRRRERYPERSVYNQLCDLEWDDVPIGEAGECGGDVMMRVDALAAVGGYRADLIAGEEPELCLRLQRAGWIVWRIDAEMTLHDAAINRLTQWGRRTTRNGYALAQGAALHGAGPERYRAQASRRTWLWGFWAPWVGIALIIAFGPIGAVFYLIYAVQFFRLLLRNKGSLRERALRSFFQVVGRFPESFGQLKYLRDRIFNRQTRLIEYK
jgi:glycosyltransferase involved in cell wall biosynthesis